MSALIDLREHFGIWDRCGNSRFFKKQSKTSKIYLNPLDGVLVSAHQDHHGPGYLGPKTYTLIIRDGKNASDAEVAKSYERNDLWVQMALKQFFYYKAMGWALDAIRGHTGRPQLPGDRDMGNFLNFYKSGGEAYRKEGGRDYQQFYWEGNVLKDRGDQPLLEETLEAILRTISEMKSTIVDYGRRISEADVEEALADLGIIEC